jgi:hypothetical protein
MKGMKHILFADKTILLGDDAADALVAYAVALGANQTADRVEYTGIGADGATIQVSFLLNSGASLVSETTPSELPEPDNHEEVQRIQARTEALVGSHPVQPGDGELTSDFDAESALDY